MHSVYSAAPGDWTLFNNVSEKGRILFIEGNHIHFITGICGTVARDDCFAVVAIK